MLGLRIVVVAALLALGGCTGDAAPEGTSEPPRSPGVPTLIFSRGVPDSGGPAADDPPGALACRQARTVIAAGTLMNPGVASGVAQAAINADAPIADAALRLLRAYEQAVAARGTEGEPDAVAAVSAAGAEFAGVCADSGLDTVG